MAEKLIAHGVRSYRLYRKSQSRTGCTRTYNAAKAQRPRAAPVRRHPLSIFVYTCYT